MSVYSIAISVLSHKFVEELLVLPRLTYKGGSYDAGETDSAVAGEPGRARDAGAMGAASERPFLVPRWRRECAAASLELHSVAPSFTFRRSRLSVLFAAR
jgi:hypothetical protein